MNYREDSDRFIEYLTSFNQFNKETIIQQEDSINYYINEFWTSKQRQSHSLHEISYRGCFKAQLPEFFIKNFTAPDDIVFDPFMGRGTTPLQAGLMKRQAFGNDINPLSTMLIRPRLNPVDIEDIDKALKGVDWKSGEIQNEQLLVFYHHKTLQKLEALRNWLKNRLSDSFDPVADWIRMVAISRLSGHSSGFFSVRSMPPNQTVSIKTQKVLNEKAGITPPERDISALILKKSKSLLRDPQTNGSKYNFSNRDAADTGLLQDSVDLIVTSPPFLDVIQYADDNWLRCWFADIDSKSIGISICKTENSWFNMIKNVLIEQCRILSPGGYLAFEVGEIRNGKLLLEKLVWKAVEELPFNRVGIMINSQKFTKTANCWGVDNDKKGTNTNRIVLLQKL